MKILVALSGGIDSSVTAHLLKEQGHELIGVRFTLWTDPLAPAISQILPSKCCNAQTAARTHSVAKTLGIPLHILDLEQEFKEGVVDVFLDGYKKGITPNPCIGCNREIKFGKLLELASELGCEKLATGHYARVAVETLADASERHLLLEAVDQTKDQSYYLYGLSQRQLARVLFPLGSMRKSEVFALARHYGVPFDEHYKESMDLCFFPEKSPQEFLKRYLGDSLTPGSIVREDGTVVGTHRGLPLYTVGQRRGLGIGGLKVPLEVIAKRWDRNEIVVAEKESVKLDSIALKDLRWISWSSPEHEETAFECRVRSLSARMRGTLTHENSAGIFHFETPCPPLAPGQSLVLYRGEEVVGGGVMEH
jgi:tRNA-uridine 2-sulfurtransferase